MVALSAAVFTAMGVTTASSAIIGMLQFLRFGITGALIGGGIYLGTGRNFGDGALKGWEIAMIVYAVVSFARMAAEAMSECFAAGTLVKTEDGDKPIEEIEAGDKVRAYNEETGESDWKEVVQVFRNSTDKWYLVDVDGQESIKCTGEHPFYVLNTTTDRPIVMFEGRDESSFEGQWVAAKDLKVGDKCLLADGKEAIIKALDVEHLSAPETTYNFEVADFHTYYVGEQGILVHNACPPKKITYDSKQVGKKWGKHKFDYPNMKDYPEYIQLADDVFYHPDSIIETVTRSGPEFHYMQGNNLLRVKSNGEFISLYPLSPK